MPSGRRSWSCADTRRAQKSYTLVLERLWQHHRDGWNLDVVFAACLGLQDEVAHGMIAFRLDFRPAVRPRARRPRKSAAPGDPQSPEPAGDGDGRDSRGRDAAAGLSRRVIVLPCWPADVPSTLRLYSPYAGRVEAHYGPGSTLRVATRRKIRVRTGTGSPAMLRVERLHTGAKHVRESEVKRATKPTERRSGMKPNLILLTAVLLAPLAALHAAEPESPRQTLAFPGAEGHGAFARGGRGGRVVHVTTLKKRGPGSLAWAINEVKEPRTIVFDVSGVINCNNEIAFTITPENDHVTIAGETSPMAWRSTTTGASTSAGRRSSCASSRFRGTRIRTKNDPDGLLIIDAQNVIVDHCSFARRLR